MIGFNSAVPIIPFFIRDLGVSDPSRLNIWVGACATITAVCAFLFAPLWGQLADSYGKRLMLLRALIARSGSDRACGRRRADPGRFLCCAGCRGR